MKHIKRAPSLKWQLATITLACWLIPVLLVLAVMGVYISNSLSRRSAESLVDQFDVNVRMSAYRLDGAVQASRRASYDGLLDGYVPGETPWAYYYRDIYSYLARQYQTDKQFAMAAFWLSEDPKAMRCGLYNANAGGALQDLNGFWARGQDAMIGLAEQLDTYAGFFVMDGRLYLARNLVDRRYQPLGVLVLELNRSYFFENFTVLPWASDVTLALDGGLTLTVKGGRVTPWELGLDSAVSGLLWEGRDKSAVYQVAGGDGYTLSALAKVDVDALLSQSQGYTALLLGMGVILLPMLLLILTFFRRKISSPIQAMMEGAREIEDGRLGHQLTYQANSQEFQYLTDSFNHMSGQLRSQFDHIYQEELALRDARIKALQSHINPHFLNNTLEIINWEARMSGDARVSKMIEALSTVLDAAIDRGKKPEVRLAEEMRYVSAYLYIISERFGKRLNVTVDMPEALMDYMVPRLILQPVIENAVEHGIGPGGCGKITLRGRRSGNLLLLETENDGTISPENQKHIDRLLAPGYDATREPSGNLGISNVNQRLRILYGEPSGLTIRQEETGLVTARITIVLKE